MIIWKSWTHKLITSFSFGNVRRNQYWLLKSLDSFRYLWIAVFKMLPDTHESNFVRQILQNLLLNLLSFNKCWQSFTVSASVFFKNLLKMSGIDTKWRFKIVAMHSLLSGFPGSRTVGQNLKRCTDCAILCLKRRFYFLKYSNRKTQSDFPNKLSTFSYVKIYVWLSCTQRLSKWHTFVSSCEV